MRHRIRLLAEIVDGMGHAASDVHECEIAQLAIGTIEAGGELGGKLENEPWALGGNLPETGIGHLRQLALVAGAHPGAARRLVAEEEAHLAEELTSVEVREHHLVAFLVLDHHLDRAADDVVKDIRKVTRMDDDRLRRYGADAAVAQEPVDRRDVAQ